MNLDKPGSLQRSLRRHHYGRRKVAAKKKLVVHYGIEDPTPGMLGFHANVRRACSCPMCGNPRRHFGERTVQERRAFA